MKQKYMKHCETVEYNGKEYLARAVTVFKNKTYYFAEEQLSLDLHANGFADGGTDIDELFAAYPPRECLVGMSDRALAKYIEREFYDNQSD